MKKWVGREENTCLRQALAFEQKAVPSVGGVEVVAVQGKNEKYIFQKRNLFFMSKIVGFCIALLVVGLIGASGFIGYELGKEKGYNSGSYDGEQSCRNALDLIFKQGFFQGFCTYNEYLSRGYLPSDTPTDSTSTICEQFRRRYMMPYYADTEEYTGFFMCNSNDNKCLNVYYNPPCDWLIEDPEN
ncbi:MAG: hypothetical protein WBD09_07245 [Halobacteriota archaeon]